MQTLPNALARSLGEACVSVRPCEARERSARAGASRSMAASGRRAGGVHRSGAGRGDPAGFRRAGRRRRASVPPLQPAGGGASRRRDGPRGTRLSGRLHGAPRAPGRHVQPLHVRPTERVHGIPGRRRPEVVELPDTELARLAVDEFRTCTGYDARPLAVEREVMPAWDGSWGALQGWASQAASRRGELDGRPGIPGRLAEARRTAERLAGARPGGPRVPEPGARFHANLVRRVTTRRPTTLAGASWWTDSGRGSEQGRRASEA